MKEKRIKFHCKVNIFFSYTVEPALSYSEFRSDDILHILFIRIVKYHTDDDDDCRDRPSVDGIENQSPASVRPSASGAQGRSKITGIGRTTLLVCTFFMLF